MISNNFLLLCVCTVGLLFVDLTRSDDSETEVVDYEYPTDQSASFNTYHTYYFNVKFRFNQEKLDPKDYHEAIFNPYLFRIPNASQNYDDYLRSFSIDDDFLNFERIVSEELGRTTTVSSLNPTWVPPSDSYYVSIRPEFCDRNIRYIELLTRKKTLLKLYGTEGFQRKIKEGKILENLALIKEALNEQHISCKMDFVDETENTEGTVNPIKVMNKNSVMAMQTLMSLLPLKNEDSMAYSQKFMELLKLMKEMNPKIRNSNPKAYTTINLSVRDVELLKSPIILKWETYFQHMMRMKRLEYIPFDYTFSKQKFKAFENCAEDEIIDAPDAF